MKKIFSHLKEYGSLYGMAIFVTCILASIFYLCFLIANRHSVEKDLATELLNSNNKYSVTLSNKNWTWDNIKPYEIELSLNHLYWGGEDYKKVKRYEAFKKYNALYFKDEIVGVFFSVSFEDKEPKLYFNLRDDIKITSNSHLMLAGKDFLIIENPMGVYDDKKEFSYINNNSSLPYENNKEIKEQKITVRGLEIADLSSAIANKYKIYGKKGVVVTKSFDFFKNGDLIFLLAGEPVENIEDFCNIVVNATQPTIAYLRQGEVDVKYLKARYNKKKFNDNDCFSLSSIR